MYFSNKNKNGNFVKTIIIKKIHLIDNLKTNMLINIDLIESKKIDINIFNRTAYIDNYKIIVFLKIRISRTVVQTLVYARKIIIVFSRSKITISIYYNIISVDRNFFFELNEFNFSLYAHLVNFKFKHILIKNKNNQIVHISRNCRIKYITELKFFNAFQMHKNEIKKIVDFTLCPSIKKDKID